MKRPVFEHCPLLIPALCLAIGIALGDHIPHGVPMLPVLLAAIAVTLLAGRWPLVQSLGVSLCFTLLGMTIASKDDERLADGYYYSKTMRLIRKLLENPELLELPLKEEVEY